MLENKIKYSFLPPLITVCLLPIGIDNALTVLLLLAVSLFLVLYFARDRFLSGVLLAGFLIRAAIAIIDDKLALLPYAWDDFYTTALVVKENLQLGYPIFYGIEKSIHLKSYASFNALLFMLFGNAEITIRLLNCLLGVLVAERIYRICRLLNINQRAAQIVVLLVVFWPSFILFNSLNMRDTLVVYLSTDMIYRFAQNTKRASFLRSVMIFSEFVFLVMLRTQNVLVYMSVLAGYILYSRVFKKSWLNMFSPVPLVMMALAIVVFVFVSRYFDGLLRYLNVETQWRATGGSAYLVNQTYDSWFDVIKFVPIRFVYFCFGPFPWQINNGFMALAFLESVAFLVFFVATFRLFWKKESTLSSTTVLLLLFAVLGLAANSLIDSNYGTAIRHKMNYITIFMIFAAPALQEVRLRFF